MGSACIVMIIIRHCFAQCNSTAIDGFRFALPILRFWIIRRSLSSGAHSRDPVADDDGRTCLIARADAAGSYFRDFIGRAIECRITSRGAIACASTGDRADPMPRSPLGW